MNKVSSAKFLKTGMFFVSMLVAGSLVTDTAIANDPVQLQPGVKRKFGPGQNAQPRGVRPQGARPQARPGPQQQPQGPPADIIAREGKWVVQCDAQNPAATGPKKARQCGVLQTVVNKTNQQIRLTLIFRQAKQNKKTATTMQILVPIGVYLPTGVALEVDGKAAGRVPFSRCDPRFCIAFAQMRPDTLSKMKKGKKGKFLIYQAPGMGIPLDLELAGFSAAFKALETAQK